MTKEKARDILREAVSYIIDRNKNVDGGQDFKTEVNDMEDFLLDNYFNK